MNVFHGGGEHFVDESWNGNRHVFELYSGATLRLPSAGSIADEFAFDFDLATPGSHAIEVKTTDPNDALNGHWRTNHPQWQRDGAGDYVLDGNGHRIFTGWGAAQLWGLFAAPTQSSGRVWKRDAWNWGMVTHRGISGHIVSQDTYTHTSPSLVGNVTPKSSGEVCVVNCEVGEFGPADMFLSFGNLLDWCPEHLNPDFLYGNYLHHILHVRKDDNSPCKVALGMSDGTGFTPSNDIAVTGNDRGYLYLTRPSTVSLRVTQVRVDVLHYFDHATLPSS